MGLTARTGRKAYIKITPDRVFQLWKKRCASPQGRSTLLMVYACHCHDLPTHDEKPILD
jgi:hypothetical protein